MKKAETNIPKELSIGGKVKFFRILKGFTQSEVAEKLNVDVKTYQNIENDITDAPISRLNQIAQVYEISLFEMFGIGEKNFYYVHSGNQANTHGSVVVHASNENQQNLAHENEKLIMQVQFLEQRIKDLEALLNAYKPKE